MLYLNDVVKEIGSKDWTPSSLGTAGSSAGKESACNAGDPGSIPGLETSPWRRHRLPTPVFLPGESPRTEEPGGLQSAGLQRIGHNWATKHSTADVKWTHFCWRNYLAIYLFQANILVAWMWGPEEILKASGLVSMQVHDHSWVHRHSLPSS